MGKGGNAAAWLLAPGAMVSPFTQDLLNGQKQAKQEKAALADQQNAQDQALAAAQKQQQQAQQDYNQANRQQPDTIGMLTNEQNAARRAQAATLLTGAFGVDPNQLKLGRKTLLGG